MFHTRDLHVIHTSPRSLVVDSSDNNKCTARFISAHVPSADHVLERIEFSKLLSRFCHTSLQIFLLVDANSRCNIDEYVGDVHFKVRNAVDQFASFPSQHELTTNFSLSAFTNKCRDICMSLTGDFHTIDYVCFKSAMFSSATDASTLRQVDNGHLAEHHWPSFVEFAYESTSSDVRNSSNRKISEEELRDPIAVQKFRECLAKTKSPHWRVGLNEHHNHMSDCISKAMHVAFPKPKVATKKPHVNTGMLTHVRRSRDVKRQIRRVKAIVVPPTLEFFEAQSAKEHRLLKLVGINKLLRKVIRIESRAGSTQYVLSVFGDINSTNLCYRPAQAWKAIKKLVALSKSSKHAPDKSVPLLIDASGVPAETSAEKARVFFDRFSKIEHTTTCDASSLIDKYNSGSVCCDATVSIVNVMSPYDFKMNLASGKQGKKGGSDNVNTDLAMLDPDSFTRLDRPVHVQTALYADEPLELKGGVACVLKKKATHRTRI